MLTHFYTEATILVKKVCRKHLTVFNNARYKVVKKTYIIFIFKNKMHQTSDFKLTQYIDTYGLITY